MPRPMFLGPKNKEAASLHIDMRTDSRQQLKPMEKHKLDRLLRNPRSKAYMEAMRHLDAGGHTHNQHLIDEITDAIRAEFPEVDLNGVLLGFVSKCYLGHPYEVHSIDLTGEIIEHYTTGHPLPNGMEKARSLAMRGGYEFIEVYADCLRCIGSNGSVSYIAC